MGPGKRQNISAVLDSASDKWAGQPVIREGVDSYTYDELWRMSRTLQTYLANLGIRSGDRVAWMLPNSAEAVAVCFGGLGIGAVLVPLNPLLSEREVANQLRDSGAVACFVDPHRYLALRNSNLLPDITLIALDGEFWENCSSLTPASAAVGVDADDPACIIYTAGTSGDPKGVVLSHGNLLHSVGVAVEISEAKESDVLFGGLPFTHIFGQTCVLFGAVMVGASMTLMERFEPESALEIVERDRVSIFVGVPTMFVSLLSQMDLRGVQVLESSLRVIISGGAALSAETVEEVETRLDAMLLESYGLTEAAGYVLSERPEHVSADRAAGARKAGSVGTAVRDCEVRIVDPVSGTPMSGGEPGALQIRGKNVMTRYWNNPEGTRSTFDRGWLVTGDLAYTDQSGRFFIIGRSKELIVRGGYNVHPREVEEVLHGHPSIEEVAVVGRDDEVLGQEIIAAVVFHRDYADHPQEEVLEDLRSYARRNLAKYKYPRVFMVLPELPKSATGKVLKTAIETS